MKIVFLDVDGVLNSGNFSKKMFEEHGVKVFYENILDERALSYLKQIISKTNAHVVVSSTWRLHPNNMMDLEHQLSNHGIEVHSCTPNTNGTRGQDISRWLYENGGDEVEQYVILDDDDDMGIHSAHLVKTTFEFGLQQHHIKRAVDMLNNPE